MEEPKLALVGVLTHHDPQREPRGHRRGHGQDLYSSSYSLERVDLYGGWADEWRDWRGVVGPLVGVHDRRSA